MFPRENKLDRMQAKKSNNRGSKRYYSHLKNLDTKIEETEKQISNIPNNNNDMKNVKEVFIKTVKKMKEERRKTIETESAKTLKQLEKEAEHLRIAASWVSKIKTPQNYRNDLTSLTSVLVENKLNGELTKITIELQEKIKQNS